MICLSVDEPFSVKPRWPYSHIFVSDKVYKALLHVQRSLVRQGIQLIVTRGFENQGSILRWIHKAGRVAGAGFFLCVYPRRWRELPEIFSSNGHDDENRDCVDIGFMEHGQKIVLLPSGAFTPLNIARRIRNKHSASIETIFSALTAANFVIHSNFIEASQIHCELKV